MDQENYSKVMNLLSLIIQEKISPQSKINLELETKGMEKLDLASNRMHLTYKVHNQKHVHFTMWLKKVIIEMGHPTSYSQHVVHEMKHDASKFLT